MSWFCYDAQQTYWLLCVTLNGVRRTWIECLSWRAVCQCVCLPLCECVCKNAWMWAWARGQETTWLGFLLKAGSSIFTLKQSQWVSEWEPPTAAITPSTVKCPDSKWYQVFRTTRTTAAFLHQLTAELTTQQKRTKITDYHLLFS